MSDQIEKHFNDNLKGQERSMFDALLKSYFLDDDQLDYLHQYYKPIFTIADNEDCICFSGKKYQDCCKPLVLATPHARDEYLSILQAISDPQLKEQYLYQEKEHYTNVRNQQQQNECILRDCQNPVVRNDLYNPELIKGNYFIDRYQEKHFFKNIKNNFLALEEGPGDCPYYFYLLCQNHSDEYLNNPKLLTPQLKALLMNIGDNLIDHQVCYETFINFYQLLSVAEQVILTLKIRKLIKLHLIYELELYRLVNDLDNTNKSYLKHQIVLKKPLTSFTINDILLAQITPITFQAINSPNNPFLPNKLLFVINTVENNTGVINFYYHKNNRIYNLYFNEWTEKIKTDKEWLTYSSSLIINQTNHILINQKYYDKLNSKTKELINIYYYNRFEQPRNSGEELMLQTFINNFNKGINIIK
ncbi:hypothetical protein [Spiroplasma sp. DGKH1]|uniref:hypothetical protein n=1 Tax=Spiroplasma sp. DGKH1 TaxID=3050074 RepID=UPI0034C6D998